MDEMMKKKKTEKMLSMSDKQDNTPGTVIQICWIDGIRGKLESAAQVCSCARHPMLLFPFLSGLNFRLFCINSSHLVGRSTMFDISIQSLTNWMYDDDDGDGVMPMEMMMR